MLLTQSNFSALFSPPCTQESSFAIVFAADIDELTRQLSDLESRLKSGAEEDADLHLGFYLDENGDLCQVDEEVNNG